MKSLKAILPRELEYVELIPIADTHIGDPRCRYDLIKELVEYIRTNKNAYCILNGDLINNAIKSSVSDIYHETLNPMQQLELAVKLFEPIKDKILAVTYGNHEARTSRECGLDVTDFLVSQLDIKDKYVYEAGMLFLRFGEVSNGHKESNGSGKKRMICYGITFTHGSGGGKKEGSKLQIVADMASKIDADIYIHSHSHFPAIFKLAFFRTDIQNSTVNLVDKLFLNTGSALEYGGYAESGEFKPSSKAIPRVIMNGRKKEMQGRV